MTEINEGYGDVGYTEDGSFARIENVIYALKDTNCRITRYNDRLAVLIGPHCEDQTCMVKHTGLGFYFEREDIPVLRRLIDEIESELDIPMEPVTTSSVFIDKEVKL